MRLARVICGEIGELMWRDWGVNVERLGSKYGEIGELMWRDWGINIEKFYIVLHI